MNLSMQFAGAGIGGAAAPRMGGDFRGLARASFGSVNGPAAAGRMAAMSMAGRRPGLGHTLG